MPSPAVRSSPNISLPSDNDEVFSPPSFKSQSSRLHGMKVEFATPCSSEDVLEGNTSPKGLLITPPYAGLSKVEKSSRGKQVDNHQLESVRLVLAEQRNELNRIVDSFEKRLLAVCQTLQEVPPPCTAEMQAMVDTTVVHIESADPQCHSLKSQSPSPSGGIESADPPPFTIQRFQKTKAKTTTSSFSTPQEPEISHRRAYFCNDDESNSDDLQSKMESEKAAARSTKLSSSTPSTKIDRLVHSAVFETCSCVVITMDAILTGVVVDHSARNQHKEGAKVIQSIDLVCLIWYSVEILLRFLAAPRAFFVSTWNLFDVALVSFDLFARVVSTAADFGGNVAVARMVRMLRLFRAFRLFRMLRYLHELRMMVKCILACSKTVLWVLLLLSMNIYVFAVYLVGQVTVSREEELNSRSDDRLQQRFGTLSDGCLSLFMAISGGVSWVEFTDPLISLHWTNGVVVFIFIFFTMFALLNIVTGVFVDGAITAGREDDEEIFQSFLDAERMNLKKLRQLSECISDNDDGYISREELEIHLAQPEVRLLFKTFGLGCHQARDLFKMLNVDGTGRVTIDEFMNYLTRMQDGLHLNVLTILYEHKRMGRKLRRFENDTWSGFEELTDRMSMLEKKLHKSGSRRTPQQ